MLKAIKSKISSKFGKVNDDQVNKELAKFDF